MGSAAFRFRRTGRDAQCHIVFPQSDSFKCFSEAYQAFERPLPRGHGSVESVSYRAVTARERSFNHGLSQQKRWRLYSDGGKLYDIGLNRLPHTQFTTFTRPGVEFVGQAIQPASSLASEVFIPISKKLHDTEGPIPLTSEFRLKTSVT